MLTRDTIQKTIDQLTAEDDAKYGYLKDSDLARQTELVKLTLGLNLEEMSKLWSVFFQTSHTLSVAYVASVVLLEAPVTVREGPPVLRRNLLAIPFQPPVITRLIPDRMEFEQGAKLQIRGANLGSEANIVLIDGEPVDTVDSRSNDTLLLTLPAMKAGLRSVAVVNRVHVEGAAADPALGQKRETVASNAAVLAIVPQFSFPPAARSHRATCSPFLPTRIAAQAKRDPAARRPVSCLFRIGGKHRNRFHPHSNGLPKGAYPVRLKVDGIGEPPATRQQRLVAPT